MKSKRFSQRTRWSTLDEMDERRPSMVEELQAWNSWYTQHPEPGVSEARRTQKALRTPTVKSSPKKIIGPDNPTSYVL